MPLWGRRLLQLPLMIMNKIYGTNFTTEELEALNKKHFEFLNEIGAVYFDGFGVAGKPKFSLTN